jgi:predicted nucleotidyltransferase
VAGIRPAIPTEQLGVDPAALRDFCQRWMVVELALFGSALRPDFRPDSDVDILIRWAPDAHWGLFDHGRMEDELADLFGRPVDLVSYRAIEDSTNWILRRSILESAQPFYVA